MALLGFSSFYREGFEVVLFLQRYRLRLGSAPVTRGVLVGLLGAILLVMVGEQAQEMQLAHWIPTTPVAALAARIPAWAGLWFAVFPTVEPLAAQATTALLVLGSYAVMQRRLRQARVPSS